MIYVNDLCKQFGDNKVLRNITEHIEPGEKVVIIGPSGSGKSTFLRCLNLLEQPTAGTITFDGQEITAPHTDINKVRQHMGMVFQHFNLFANLTVKQNITLAPVLTKLMTKQEAEAQIAQTKQEQTRLLQEATRTRAAIIEKAELEASEKAARLLEKAKMEIAIEKESALRDIRKEVAMLSVDIAEKVVREQLSADSKQMAYIDRLVQEMTQPK